MALLGSKAFVGFDEVERYVTEENLEVNARKRNVLADIINLSCMQIEQLIDGPVITRQFSEYYYGADQQRLRVHNRPFVISTTPARDVTVRVRKTGDLLDQADSSWETWTRNTDFVVDDVTGLLIVNPAERDYWPTGFRNIYVSYYAGWGDQTLDATNEVVTSTAPDDLKQAVKKIIEYWYKSDIIEFGHVFNEDGETKKDKSENKDSMPLPPMVKALLKPYTGRAAFRWEVH